MINYNFPLIGGKVIERRISEWMAKGRDEGRVEGVVEGMEKKNAEWSAWNSRRVEAERSGVPFDEPSPDEVSR